MEKHIKTIYKELLDEANSNKRLRDMIEEEDEKITEINNQIKEKNHLVSIFKHANDNFEYDITQVISDAKFETWEVPLKALKEKYTEKLKELDKILFDNPDNVSNAIYNQIRDKGDDSKQQNIL